MFEYKPLPYAYNALNPYISSDTLHYHHDKHYQNYVNNLNKNLSEVNYTTPSDIAYVIKNIEMFPIAKRGNILFNAGGVNNHELYFNSMGNSNHEPIGELKDAIMQEYGSMENFIKTYEEEAQKLVGSGYTFLVLNKDNQLEIINTANQDSPYSYGLYPIIALDLWEHAYYLDYQNRRNDYIHNFFQILDFAKIEKQYEKSKQELQKNI